ncbi:MAG: hypothetical protein ACYC8T_32940 [Myxococcaceae bacterium]
MRPFWQLVVLPAVMAASLCCADGPSSSPCVKTGCSQELCADGERASPCIYEERFACYRAARCERQADGGCGFTSTPELERCLKTAEGRSGRAPSPAPR